MIKWRLLSSSWISSRVLIQDNQLILIVTLCYVCDLLCLSLSLCNVRPYANLPVRTLGGDWCCGLIGARFRLLIGWRSPPRAVRKQQNGAWAVRSRLLDLLCCVFTSRDYGYGGLGLELWLDNVNVKCNCITYLTYLNIFSSSFCCLFIICLIWVVAHLSSSLCGPSSSSFNLLQPSSLLNIIYTPRHLDTLSLSLWARS